MLKFCWETPIRAWRYQPIVSDINLLEEEIAPLSDDQLRLRLLHSTAVANAGSLQTSNTVVFLRLSLLSVKLASVFLVCVILTSS